MGTNYTTVRFHSKIVGSSYDVCQKNGERGGSAKLKCDPPQPGEERPPRRTQGAHGKRGN